MKKTLIENNVFIPMPVVLVGANVKNKANFMAAGWLTRVNSQPPMISVSLSSSHYTVEGILENQTFSINLSSEELAEKIDYCGLFSGKNIDKSSIFNVFYGKTKTAPMIEESPLCLECRLAKIIELPSNILFIGEIISTFSENRFLENGELVFEKINPLILTMPDNKYWTIGDCIGKAWDIGKSFKSK